MSGVVRLMCLLAVMLVTAACANALEQPAMAVNPQGRMHAMRADMVLFGGIIVTGVQGRPHAEAIAVRRGKVLWVGDSTGVEALIDDDTLVLDLEGALVLPGLVDAHAHVAGLGSALAHIDLGGTKSYEEVVARVVGAAAAKPEGWLVGRGWDQNDWPDKVFPDGRKLEEALPGRAVWLQRIDGHAGLASPAALLAAGVTDDVADPQGGKTVRDGDGKLTGVLVDNAMTLVASVVPAPSLEERREALDKALATVASVGITGVHDMGVSASTLAIYKELDAAGTLPVRVYAVLDGKDPTLGEIYQKGPYLGRRLIVRAVKLYADGALGSRGAALLADYSDDAGNRGLLVTEPAALEAEVARAVAAGFQPCIHAIGDRGNRVVLDALEKSARAALRPRIEHAQVVSLSDIPRMARLGVVASMQPTHATSDMPWAEARLGPERLAGAYAWRTLAGAGVTLAFGSDFPVERPHVLEGLYAALTRQDRQGKPAGGWLPRERLDFATTLAAFTTGPAFASFDDRRRGLLKPGHDADMTVVRGAGVADLVRDGAPASALLRADIALTIVGGQVSYTNDALAPKRRVGRTP